MSGAGGASAGAGAEAMRVSAPVVDVTAVLEVPREGAVGRLPADGKIVLRLPALPYRNRGRAVLRVPPGAPEGATDAARVCLFVEGRDPEGRAPIEIATELPEEFAGADFAVQLEPWEY